MTRAFLVLVLILNLAACKQETAQDVAPVALTAEAVGHFCQMDLLEHPGPKAQVHLEGLPGRPLYFSQVRDGIAYTRMPEQSYPILAFYVNDMGAAGASWDDPGARNWILADQAWFVLDSRREGGMGAPEMVPFREREAALAFAAREGGHVVRLHEISDDMVLAPVETGNDKPGNEDESDESYKERLRALSSRPAGG
jgi:copper chaperone NosL